ncbi:phosphoribosylglycinamide formyltransferase [Streptomyces sp. NPDC014685]|uniref:phosphoribosylglycinamide formyltransferase n=1 Tax=Streptomyces sp. NPDC014685 TaxID=3364881 RepID=UPI0036F72DA4
MHQNDRQPTADDLRLHALLTERCARGTEAALLMSGAGTNARVLLKAQADYPRLRIGSLFTDRPDSAARDIAQEHGLPCYVPERRIPAGRLAGELREWLVANGAEVFLCAGFMRIIPDEICLTWPGMNVHPADLTVTGQDGRARYTGMDAVPDALSDGRSEVRASAHLVRNPVDEGMVLAVSRPVPATADEDPDAVHERLRTQREHRLYPEVLRLLAAGSLKDPGSLPVRDLA